MAQIPLQFLGGSQLPSAGRRRAEVAQTEPGVAERAEAIALAASRNLDLTPIGDALYRVGSEFVEMERERRKMELILQRQKQESAVRSHIVYATQKASDLFEQMKSDNVSDPQEARDNYYNGLNAIKDEAREALGQLGPWALEAYDENMANMAIKFGPEITKFAMGKSKELLTKNMLDQQRDSLHIIGSVDDDDIAEGLVQQAYDGIMVGGMAHLSEYDRVAMGKSFLEEATRVRFRKKLREDAASALEWLDAQTGLDHETLSKIRKEAFEEVNTLNSYTENQQNAADKESDRLRTQRASETWSKITAAERKKDFGALQALHAEMVQNPHAFKEGDFQSYTNHINKLLDPSAEDDYSSPFYRDVHKAVTDPRTPPHIGKALIDRYVSQLSPRESIKLMDEVNERERGNREPINQARTRIHKNIEARLAPHFPPGISLDNIDEEDTNLFAGNGMMSGPMQEHKKKFKELLNRAYQDAEVYITEALSTGGATKNNYEALINQANQIVDNVVNGWDQTFADSNKAPEPPGGSIEKMFILYEQKMVDKATLDYHLNIYGQTQKDEKGFYDPNKDPIIIRAREQSSQMRAQQDTNLNAGGASKQNPELGFVDQTVERLDALAQQKNQLPETDADQWSGTGVGDRLDDAGFNALVDKVGYAALSASEESGGGADQIGVEKDGTKSYGTFQIHEPNMPGFLKFLGKVDPGVAAQFKGLKPGTRKFNDAWKRVARQQPEFGAQQLKYVGTKFFMPAYESFQDVMGFEEEEISDPLKMMIFSTSVQHGNYTKIFKMTRDLLPDLSIVTEDQMAKAFYKARTQYVNDLSDAKVSPAQKAAIGKRYQRELSRVLSLINAGSTKEA